MKKILMVASTLAVAALFALPAAATCKGKCGEGPKSSKASISIGSQGFGANMGGGTAKGNRGSNVVTKSVTTKAFGASSQIDTKDGKTSVRGNTYGHVATAGISMAGASGKKAAGASTYESGAAVVGSDVEINN